MKPKPDGLSNSLAHILWPVQCIIASLQAMAPPSTAKTPKWHSMLTVLWISSSRSV